VIPARTFRTAALAAVISVGVAALGHELFYLPWLRSVLAHGESSLQDTSAEALNGEIREALPLGSSQSAVETLLRSRQVPYGFSSAQEIDAAVNGLKGDSPSGRAGLLVKFRFDDHEVLRGIDSRIFNAGR
jgi:hypothetical protein